MPGASAQMGLFGPVLDVLPPLKSEMAKALKASGLSREQALDKLNALLESEGISQNITLNTLEKWVAPAARHVIPLRLLPFFCRAVKSSRPIEVLAASLGLVLAGAREQELMRLGEAAIEAKRASSKRRRAMEALEEFGL